MYYFLSYALNKQGTTKSIILEGPLVYKFNGDLTNVTRFLRISSENKMYLSKLIVEGFINISIIKLYQHSMRNIRNSLHQIHKTSICLLQQIYNK